MAEELVFKISGDSAGAVRAIQEASRSLSGLAQSTKEANTHTEALGKNASTTLDTIKGFIGAQAILATVKGGFEAIKSTAIGMNAMLESSTFQFETLMGSADKARQHVRDLFEIAKKTPFETGPIIQASRMLQTFGGSALNTKKNIMMIGDASAATQAPINELGFWVGRLYSAVKGGQPFGEAAMRLQELAVMTPEARREMERMQKAGKDTDDVWQVFAKSMEKFTGAMEKQARTWTGVTSTFSDIVKITVADTFQPFFALLRDGIGDLNDWLQGDTATRYINKIKDAVAELHAFVKYQFIPTVREWGEKAVNAGVAIYDTWNKIPAPVRDTVVAVGELTAALWLMNAAITAIKGSVLFTTLAPALTGVVAKVTELGAFTSAFGWEGFTVILGEWATALTTLLGPLGLVVGSFATLRGLAGSWTGAFSDFFSMLPGGNGMPLFTASNLAGVNLANTGPNDTYKNVYIPGVGAMPMPKDLSGVNLGFLGSEIPGTGKGEGWIDGGGASSIVNPEEITKAQEKFAEKVKKIREDLYGKNAIDTAKEWQSAVTDTHKLSGDSIEKYRKILIEAAQAEERLGNAKAANLYRTQAEGLLIPTTGSVQAVGPVAPGKPDLGRLGAAMTDWNNQKSSQGGGWYVNELGRWAHEEGSLGDLWTGEDTGVPGWVNAVQFPQQILPWVGEQPGTALSTRDAAARLNASGGLNPYAGPSPNPFKQGTSMWTGTKSMFANLGTSIISAVQGGGNVGGTIGATMVGGVMGDVGKKVAGFVGKKLGETVGGLAGGVLGPLGSIAGSMLGSVIGGLFGPSKTQTAGREATKQIDDVKKSLSDAGWTLDKIKAQGSDAAKALAAVWDRKGVDGLKLMTDAAKKFEEQLAKDKERMDKLKQSTQVLSKDDLSFLKTQSKEDQAAYYAAQTQLGIGALGAIAAGGTKFTATSAKGVGGGVAGIYANLLEQGASAGDIAKTLGPTIKSLSDQFTTLGVDGGEAFATISKSVIYLNDEAVAPLIDASTGAVNLMASLANTGRLDQDTFSGLASMVSDTAAQLTLMGKGGEEMGKALQPQLQKIWEMQQEFGYSVDESTQKLIDQGIEGGTLGEKFREPADKMLAAIDKLVARMGDFIDTIMGVPKAVEKSIPKEVKTEWTVKRRYVDENGNDGGDRGAETEPFPSFDERPLERVTGAGLALLHPGDVVGVPQPGMFGSNINVNLSVQSLDGPTATQLLKEKGVPALIEAIKDNFRGATTSTKLALGIA